MAPELESRPGVPTTVERFLRQLVIVYKAVMLYPPSSPIPTQTASEAAAILESALSETPEIRFAIAREGFFYDETAVFPGHATFLAFSREFYNRRVAEVRFHAGVDADSLIAFLAILKIPPEELAAAGGFAASLWEGSVSTISVVDAKVTIVESEVPESVDETEALSPEQIDELVAKARRGGAGELTVITRLLGNTDAIRRYLTQSFVPGGSSGLARVAEAFAHLARFAAGLDADDRDERMRTIAEAVLGLAEEVRAQLVGEHLLPEARTSPEVASVLRQMDVDRLLGMLAGSSTAEELRSGMVRAIRNLSVISGMDRDLVVQAAGSVMLEHGMSPEQIDEVVAEAAPTQFAISDPDGSALTHPSDTVIELIDRALLDAEMSTSGPEVAALKEEARHGVTDGDVIGALVTLATLDTNERSFGVTMTRLESAIGLLIERGEFETAAEVTATLGEAAKNPDLSAEQRDRIVAAVAHFARSEDVKSLAQALKVYPVNSVERNSAIRLVQMLGTLAIKPLLDQLADEQDMAARKILVDAISSIAASCIPELGAEVTDSRWYFVRNVVSILGSTKSPTILPYLERTVRHPEARVRRETIRALSLQSDRVALELLVLCLYDDDAQNVQLAARFIGQRGGAMAVTRLEQVARGEGRGNREIGPRVEAIEALGRMGAIEAIGTLNALAGKRSILGGSKVRELRSAALAALRQIEPEGGAQ